MLGPLFIISPRPPDLAILLEFTVLLFSLEDVDCVQRLVTLVPIDEDADITDTQLVAKVICQPIEEGIGDITDLL
jgi:hypothetical protein